MRYFVVFFISLISLAAHSQDNGKATSSVTGTIVSDITLLPVSGANIININRVKGTVSDGKGNFTIEATANDTLHIAFIGYLPIKVRVTNDWLNNATNTKIPLTERAKVLDEVIINKYNLTGYLVIDSKLAPVDDKSYRYNISGLYAYEGGNNSPTAFKKIVSSVFNPADVLHSIFGKKPTEMRRLREMKKDDAVRNALSNKFDRETLAALLGVTKDDIAEILERCNYSEEFVKTANDLQIMDAISGCYEDYKAVNKN